MMLMAAIHTKKSRAVHITFLIDLYRLQIIDEHYCFYRRVRLLAQKLIFKFLWENSTQY